MQQQVLAVLSVLFFQKSCKVLFRKGKTDIRIERLSRVLENKMHLPRFIIVSGLLTTIVNNITTKVENLYANHTVTSQQSPS